MDRRLSLPTWPARVWTSPRQLDVDGRPIAGLQLRDLAPERRCDRTVRRRRDRASGGAGVLPEDFPCIARVTNCTAESIAGGPSRRVVRPVSRSSLTCWMTPPKACQSGLPCVNVTIMPGCQARGHSAALSTIEPSNHGVANVLK